MQPGPKQLEPPGPIARFEFVAQAMIARSPVVLQGLGPPLQATAQLGQKRKQPRLRLA